MYILQFEKLKKSQAVSQARCVRIVSIETELGHSQYQITDVIVPLTHGVVRPHRLCSEVNNLDDTKNK